MISLQKIFVCTAFLSFIFLFLLPSVIFADIPPQYNVPTGGIVQCGNQGQSPCTFCNLLETGQRILQFLIALAFAGATIAIMAGGFMMLIAGGNESQISKGRQAITYAVEGLIIVLVSFVIINTILFYLAGQNALSGGGAFPWPWNKINCS